MRRVFGPLGVVVVMYAMVAAQSAGPSLAFDVADVHIHSPSSANSTAVPTMSGGVLRGGRYDLRNATMLDLITLAYGVDAAMVLGGPNWLGWNRFDVIAKAPQDTSRDMLRLMLQALLADRFKLVLHKGTKPIPSDVLTLSGASANMKPASGQETGACVPQSGQQTANGTPLQALSCHGITMDAFAQQLANVASAYVTTRVVDETGLKGAWDFDLKWTPRASLASAGPDALSLSTALEQQLGLKLDFQKAPGPALVVDSVNDTPTASPSGVDAALPPPPPAQFDVADIKISPPDARPREQVLRGGRINDQAVTMQTLVSSAWGIDPERVVGAPSWFTSTKYSLVARTTAGSGEGANLLIDSDDMNLMLRALLADRFKLTTHMEDRPVSAYTLVVAVKPRLQPADPSNRTTWFNGPAPGAKDARETNPLLDRFVTCQNMTMAQFAEVLPAIDAGDIHEPVVDATGLDGAWDFTLSFSALGTIITGPNRSGDAGSSGTLGAADPSGRVSFFDAVQKQLGLKLVSEKRLLPVLVIDHVQEQPTDN